MQTFIHDIGAKRALQGAVFRAPFRKGKVTGLTVPELPKGYFCVRARDIPGKRTLSCGGFSLPVVAQSQVRYLGEPLLLFCGPKLEVLAEIFESIALRYEEQKPVEYADLSGPYREAQSIGTASGDVELSFSLADQIVEGEYRTARAEHYYPDTLAAVAHWNGRLLTVQAATQDPFRLRSEIARLLDLTVRKVRIIAVHTGNTMEGKLLPSVLVAAQAAALSWRAVKPVKLVYNREEDLHFTPKSPEFLIRHQTALDRDGGPVAARIQIHMDGGPYPPKDSDALRQAVKAAWGAYRIQNIEVTARSVFTDNQPIGSIRALGTSQAFFSMELHASRLAEVAQLDPVNWKRENLLSTFRSDTGSAGKGAKESQVRSGALAVMEEAAQISDFSRKHCAYAALMKRRTTIEGSSHPLRGIGLSLCYQGIGSRWECVYAERETCGLKVVLERGKRLRIYTSLVDAGMRIYELFRRTAALLLDLDPEKVSIEAVDTYTVPDTGPSTLAQAVSIGLPLLEQCCLAVKKKRPGSSPPIEVKRTVSLDKLPFRSTAAPRSGKTAEDRRSALAGGESDKSWAASVIEVELDPVTLQSICRGIWLVAEVGSRSEEKTVVRTLEGEIAKAMGYARLSGIPAAFAKAQRSQSHIEMMPAAVDSAADELARVQVHLVESKDGYLKSYEQLPHLGVAPAYAAAICQATGLYVDEIPVTPEVIQQCLQTQ